MVTLQFQYNEFKFISVKNSSAINRILSKVLIFSLLILKTHLLLADYPANPYPVPEYVPAESVIIRYPFNSNIWPIYEELIMESQEVAHTVLLVNNESEKNTLEALIFNAGIPFDNISVLLIPANRMWVRDHGPLTVKTDQGTAFMNFRDYNNSGYNDQMMAYNLAGLWGYEYYGFEWILDGGNYMVDSYGTLFTTTRLYTNNPSYTQEEIDQDLLNYMGITNIVTVSPQHNDYWGHIDMQMKLLNDTTIVISSVEPGSGPNYQILEDNVAIIESLTAPNGQPYHIARLPKADNWKTYANALFLNNKVIVPIYNHPNDQPALDTYAELMPGYTVVGINANGIIGWGGAIHCITMQVPVIEPASSFYLSVAIEGAGQVKVNGEVFETLMEVEAGAVVTLEALPDAGMAFAGWSGDLTGEENPREVTVTGNLNITAGFHRQPGYYTSLVPHRTASYAFPDYYQGLKFARVVSHESVDGGIAYHIAPTLELVDFECYSAESSFLGKKMVLLNNGSEAFFNKNNDSILLKPLAGVGQEWIAYESEDFFIRGILTAHQPETFLGVEDSVKTIGFQAYDASLNPMDHGINDLSLRISKNHGMVQGMNFFHFPFLETGGYPQQELHEIELVGLSDPDLGIVNLTWERVFDFMPGDELHIREESEGSDIDEGSGYSVKKRIIKRILSRSDENNSISYEVERIMETETTIYPPGETSTVFKHDTVMFNPGTHQDFDHPAWYPQMQGEYDLVVNTQHQITSPSVQAKTIWTWAFYSSGDCWHEMIADGCLIDETYYDGLGGPYYFCDYAFERRLRQLVYFKKGEQAWGTPLVITSATEVAKEHQVQLYPNPAHSQFNVRISHDMLPARIELFDPMGRSVFTNELTSVFSQIDSGNFGRGVYYYRITTKNNKVVTGKLILR